MRPVIIAVIGKKKSGKTTAIEILTRELANRGYRIAVVKHIPEPDFTIDREGKDTWRYAQSGAEKVIAVSSDEIATIEKVHRENVSLKEILEKCKGSDIVFLEGFRKLVAGDKEIHKIMVVKSAEDVAEALESFEPILAFTGPYLIESLNWKIPYADIFKNGKKIADLIERVFEREAAT
jgi:molybdopterin-guanine dinucleotide biosynthesis protein MobB